MSERYTLFISDLHLSIDAPQLCAHFFYFMEHIAPSAEALYVLGDFFEVWLGNDVETEFHARVRETFLKLKNRGIPIYFMKGNRDFLLGAKAIEGFGMTLLPDPCPILLYGKKWLLTHGDRLCTLDVAYQRYRRVANIKALQWLFLHSPRGFRQRLAQKIHQKNPHREHAAQLEYALADATQSAVSKDLATYKADYLLHGHTHRMGLHWHNDKLRVVLGDWRTDYFNYLCVSEQAILLKSCKANANSN